MSKLTDERRKGLGGTDAAKVLGLSRFGGPADLYMEKLGLSAELVQTEAMEMLLRLIRDLPGSLDYLSRHAG